MPLLDRHRLLTLIGLTALERTVTGPERLLREPDVALLIKAAYDDASDTARAAFMARVQAMPTSAWPWSAVQAPARPPLDVRPRGGGGIGNIGVPQPVVPATPALLLLLRGQVDSADADPGNKLPDRSTPEGAAWEPLQVALDRWDTATIRRYIRPQGWALPSADTPKEGQDAGATSGAPAPDAAPTPGVPATQTTVPLWKQPAVLVVGATALVATSVTVYALTRDSKSQRLEAELERQAQEAMKR